MLTKLFLHIGQNKTGTSYIQNFLDINRQKLYEEHHYLYPNLNSENYSKGRYHNHAGWLSEIKYQKQQFIKEIEELSRYSIRNSVEAIILSSEGWLLDDSAVELFNQITSREYFSKTIIICYLRRIDSWLESAWKQWGLKTHDNFEDYYNEERFHRQFKTILDKLNSWEKIVDLDHIQVRPYEKCQLENGLLNDFLNCIGLSDTSNNWKDTDKSNIATNYGFNRNVLEMLHLCQSLYDGKHDNRYFDFFAKLLDEQFQKQPFDAYDLLSPTQRICLINNNLPYEKQIAEKFLKRKSGRLFFEPIQKQELEWHSYQGLQLENVIPILVNLLYENNRLIEELNYNLIELGKQENFFRMAIKRIQNIFLLSIKKLYNKFLRNFRLHRG